MKVKLDDVIEALNFGNDETHHSLVLRRKRCVSEI